MVPRGLEPRTLQLLAVRSNQLSYETCCSRFSARFQYAAHPCRHRASSAGVCNAHDGVHSYAAFYGNLRCFENVTLPSLTLVSRLEIGALCCNVVSHHFSRSKAPGVQPGLSICRVSRGKEAQRICFVS